MVHCPAKTISFFKMIRACLNFSRKYQFFSAATIRVNCARAQVACEFHRRRPNFRRAPPGVRAVPAKPAWQYNALFRRGPALSTAGV
jgi:hypothetical protein